MKKIILSATFLFISVFTVTGQDGKVENLTVHATSLEENLVEESPDLSVGVFLPPDYEKNSNKRYPVVYWLHGFAGYKNTGKSGWNKDIVAAINKLYKSGDLKHMIVVMPDGTNRFGGSFYTNSLTTGNWEDFISDELPKYIDAKYRTIPKAESRGIAGHSMGGYGALKIAMKHPDVFSSVYGTCSCCITATPMDYGEKMIKYITSIDSWDALRDSGFFPKAIHGSAAAYAPNPNNPPFYSDLPYKTVGDSIVINEKAKAKWTANTLSWMASQYITNLKKLKGIAFDGATKDNLTAGSQYFSEELTRMNVKNSFEIFEGGHANKVDERIEDKILPFFSEMLVSEK